MCMVKRKERQIQRCCYIFVDDLLIASEKPQEIIQDLKEKFKLKIKGDGPLEYHLGCDYKLEKDGTQMAQPIRYINKIY